MKLSRLPRGDAVKSTKLSIDSAERVLRDAPNGTLSPESRAEAEIAYGVLANRRPAQARKLFQLFILKLIEKGEDITCELWRHYLVESKQSARKDVCLQELFTSNFDALKLLALKALPTMALVLANEDILMLVESINTLEARLLAIEYWLQLGRSADKKAVYLVLEDIESPPQQLIEKVNNVFPQKNELLEVLESKNWGLLNTMPICAKDSAKILKALHTRIASADKHELGQMLTTCQLLVPLASSESFSKALSNTLFNLGRRLRPDPAFINAWAVSIEIELGTSCDTLLEKTTRLATALLEVDAMPDVFEKAIMKLDQMKVEWGSLATALNKLVDGDKIQNERILSVIHPLMTPENKAKQPRRGWQAIFEGYFDAAVENETEQKLLEITRDPSRSKYLNQLDECELSKLQQVLLRWAVAEVLISRGRPDDAISTMLQTIAAALALTGVAANAVVMDVCVRLSQIYRFVGNMKDSFMYLKEAHKQAVRHGTQVRESVYVRMLNAIAPLVDSSEVTGTFSCPHKISPTALANAQNRYKDIQSDSMEFDSVQTNYANACKLLNQDAVFSVIPDCALSVPSLGRDTVPAVSQTLHSILLECISTKLLFWDDTNLQSQLARSMALVVSSTSSQNVPPVFNLVEEPKYSYVSMCRSTKRANQPSYGELVVVSINFETEKKLCLSRVVDGEELHVTLPLDRNDTEVATLEAVMDELKKLTDVCHESDGLKGEITPEDKKAYWSKRGKVEKAFNEFLHRVEQEWLRGFKGMLSPYVYEDVSFISQSLEDLIKRYFKATISVPTVLAQLVAGAGNVDRVGAEDIIYYIADSLQLRGTNFDYDEVDVTGMTRELRKALNAFVVAVDPPPKRDMVIIPNSCCQNFPWESLPTLRGASVGRFLSLKLLEEALASQTQQPDSVYYVLNPENNLDRLQPEFEADFRLRGWKGVAGSPPQDGEVLKALETHGWYIYLGHGSGKVCARPHRIQRLERCANAILMGCSSARTRGGILGFDGYGPHSDYAMAGCSLLVGNLWDVADRDINRFSKELLARIFDNNEPIGQAVAEARSACVLRFCTGAAPVIYGLPYATAR